MASGVLEKVTAIEAGTLRPRAVLYLHLHETAFTGDAHGVARFEHGIGPVTAERAMQMLRHHHVVLKPVIDLADQRPAEGYELPARLREALHLLRPGSVFAYAAYRGQTQHDQDADHTRPYRHRPPDTGWQAGSAGDDPDGRTGPAAAADLPDLADATA